MIPASFQWRAVSTLLFLAGVIAGMGCDLASAVDRSQVAGDGTWETACRTPEDCPAPAGTCEIAACERGSCTTAPAPDGAVSAVQQAGDCRKIVCTTGGPMDMPDDMDIPAGTHDCLIDGCAQGMPTSTFVAEGTACDEDGGKRCDGAGACVECVEHGDCAEHVCAAHACVPATCADGTANGGETDVDCGGSCGGCADAGKCVAAGDCQSGVCTGGVCTSACGDGVINGIDVCDDGNTASGDGCDDNCTPTGCGNSVITSGESCDDGNTASGDGCDDNCTLTGCGNGVITSGETCDDDNTTSGDCCSSACQIEVGCSMESEPNSTCAEGEGPVAPNPSAAFHAAIYPATDQDYFAFTVPVTADVVIETFDGAGLDACAPPVDTLVELLGPDCSTVLAADDDGGIDFCSSIHPTTHPGASQLPPGTYYARVRSALSVAILVYNVVITLISHCSDGAIQGSEGCDDGNLIDGDGCSAGCTVEPGYSCTGEPSVCIYSCGDGLLNGNEQCDDGDLIDGDGCSAACTVEAGYSCMGVPSVCTYACGDGLLNGNDQCDDGNPINGDGCSSTCQVEVDYQCTTVSPSMCSRSETNCSDGLDNDGDLLTDLGDSDCDLGTAMITPCDAGQTLFVYNSVNVPVNIPEPGSTTSLLTATHAGVIQRAVMRLSITHTWDEDLILQLSSPLGPNLAMSWAHGGNGDDYTGTIFDTACPDPIGLGSPPFTGCFAPDEPLTGFVGQQATGTWTLNMTDTFPQDAGTLINWSLALCITP